MEENAIYDYRYFDRCLTTERLYVCIEGSIGSGKSSLCAELAKRTDVLGDDPLVQYEPADGGNPYLADFYRSPREYAFRMQMFLLTHRYRMQKQAQSLVLSGDRSVVSDRSYFGDRCFAELQLMDGSFTEADFDVYLRLHKDMQEHLYYPSAFIWLKTSPALCYERIGRRMTEREGRKCEGAISMEYLTRLDERVSCMMEAMKHHTTVIQINPWKDDGSEKPLCELAEEACNWLSVLPSRYDSWQGVA